MSSPSADTVRERILDAAARLVDERPDAFSVDRVATEAGVSRATIYRRFRRVDDLLEALDVERDVTAAHARVDARTRILDAAREEFVRSGVGSTTIQSIARAAGVAQMTVYNHFEDKEGLVTALMAERGPASVLPGEIPDDEDPVEALRGFVVGALRIGAEQRDLFRLLLSPDPATRAAFRCIREGEGGVERKLAGLLRRLGLPEDADPRVPISMVMGSIFANSVLLPIMEVPLPPPEVLADRIVEMVLHGLRGAAG